MSRQAAVDAVFALLAETPDREGASAPASLDRSTWEVVAAIARTHRLGPLLHRLHARDEAIPADLRREWAEAFRAAALAALALQADLRDLLAILRPAGIEPVALKGAWLAAHAYPHPAMRPMRDLDLLVPQDRALEALRLLEAGGYERIGENTIPLEDVLRFEQHLPIIRSPRGQWLELHVRVSEPDGKLEYRTPAGNEAAILAHARPVDGDPLRLHYPRADDLLEHVVIHAIYGHRLDCGPLVLSDIRYLLADTAVDWSAFWARARAGRWESGAQLLFDLVRAQYGAATAPISPAAPSSTPAQVLAMARQLLVQDYTRKKATRFAATLMTGDLARAKRLLRGQLRAAGEETLEIARGGPFGWLRWAWSRALIVGRGLAGPGALAEARQLARYRRWLDRQG